MRGRQCDVRRILPQLLALEMREGALIQGMGVGSNLEMARKWILRKLQIFFSKTKENKKNGIG